MTLFQDKLDAMVWSYSRVKSYFECPRMFYLTYLDEGDQLESAFASGGACAMSCWTASPGESCWPSSSATNMTGCIPRK